MAATLRAGIGALAKVLLVIVGVPLALVRLFLLTPLPEPLLRAAALTRLSTWSHLVLVGVGAVWVLATIDLSRELHDAIRQRERDGGHTWSARWAGQLAGLLLLASSSTLATSVPSHPGPRRSESPPAATSVAPRTEGSRSSTTRSRNAELAALAIGALTAVALCRRARVLRRLAECVRAPGERLSRGSSRAEAYEIMLAHFGGAEVLDGVEVANRILWSVLADGTVAAPDVRLVRCGHEGIELLLDELRPVAPAPFRARSQGRWWVADRSALEGLSDRLAGRHLPYLVPVGDDGDASYLVVLRPGRRLGILGPPDEVESVLSGIVLGLRTLPWAEELDIELLGVSAPPAAERCHQLHNSSPATLADLSTRAESTPVESVPRTRLRWRREPLAVLAPAHAASGAPRAEELTATMGVICAGQAGTETLVLGGDGCLLSPFGIELNPPRLHLGERALVDEMLRDASRPAGRVVPHPLVSPRDQVGAGRVELVLFSEHPHLTGGAPLAEADARRVCELVCFLLVHARRATPEEIGAALFPRSREAAAARVANLAALARSALGEGGDGRSLVSPLLAGRYHLSEEVTGDWLRLAALARRARTSPPDNAVALLTDALELVRARPLASEMSSFCFFGAQSHLASAISDAVDAAHHLTTLLIASGHLDAARRALAVGALVEPFSEMLVRDAMVLADLDGDLDALEEGLASLERGLLAFGTEPSAETFHLYDQLRAHLRTQDRQV